MINSTFILTRWFTQQLIGAAAPLCKEPWYKRILQRAAFWRKPAPKPGWFIGNLELVLCRVTGPLVDLRSLEYFDIVASLPVAFQIDSATRLAVVYKGAADFTHEKCHNRLFDTIALCNNSMVMAACPLHHERSISPGNVLSLMDGVIKSGPPQSSHSAVAFWLEF